MGQRKHGHITQIIRELYWHPVEKRITYKILLMTFKCLNNLAPFYLSDLITQNKLTRTLRCAFMTLLVIPRTNTIRHMAKEHHLTNSTLKDICLLYCATNTGSIRRMRYCGHSCIKKLAIHEIRHGPSYPE